MADAELITDDLVQESALMPRVSDTTLDRLGLAVRQVSAQAAAYRCETEEDHEAGGLAITRIRELDTLWANIYAPIKAFWTARHKKACGEEQAQRGPLDVAKRQIAAHRLAWEVARTQRQAEIQRAADAVERRRAEDARLAQAAELDAHATRTGNTALKAEAVALLDQPLDIVPSSYAPAFTPTKGVKTVFRDVLVGSFAWRLASGADGKRTVTDADWDAAQEIKGQDLEDLIICVGASLLSRRDCGDDLRAALQPYISKCAEAAALKPDTSWIKREAKQRGETFALGGVRVVKRAGLG